MSGKENICYQIFNQKNYFTIVILPIGKKILNAMFHSQKKNSCVGYDLPHINLVYSLKQI